MRKINVLQFICPTGFYGAERWILALNNNLDPKQVRSDLVVTKEQDSSLEILNHFRSDEAQAFSIEMNSRFSLAAIRQLIDLIRKRQIDIVHTHGYKSEIMGLIAAKVAGVKTVATPHGFGEPADLKLKAFIAIDKFTLRFFDWVAPLSEQLVSEVKAAGVKDKKIKFIRNAVDLNEVDEFRNNTPKSSSDKIKIGYIGQIIPRKKVDHILDIFNQLWLENNQIELVLLGDGSSRAEMEQKAKKLPSASDIHFLGFRNDRLALLSQFDLFVMTSSDEGIPRCLMEAIAMGIPVAAYNIPGIDQLVLHEKTGLLASYGDRETLKSYWQKLLSDKTYAKKLTANGMQFINDTYSGRRMADEYTELYKTMLMAKT